MNPLERQRRRQSGSSLVEATLALGLLAGVLASIAGLFVIGVGQVRSGRTSSQALAVARTILEEVESWNYDRTYMEFGFDGTAASYSVDTRTNAAAATWQATIDEGLFAGYATIEIVSLDPPGTVVLASATQMKVMVTVFWSEGQRQRSMRLGMVRM